MSGESAGKQTYVRLNDDLLARIDRYAEKLAAREPGLKPSRSDAIRVLLHKALDVEDASQQEGR